MNQETLIVKKKKSPQEERSVCRKCGKRRIKFEEYPKRGGYVETEF